MSFDAITFVEEKRLWDALERYAPANYIGSHYHAGVVDWAAKLRKRREQGEDLRLAFKLVENTLTGRSFRGFTINDQLMISRDKASLAWPYMRNEQDTGETVYPDRRFTFRLVNLGYDEAFIEECQIFVPQKGTKTFILDEREDDLLPIHKAFARSIGDRIRSDMATPELPGGNANTVEKFELRISSINPRGAGWHPDMQAGIGEWTRNYIYPMFGAPPEYDLNGNKDITTVFGPVGPVISVPVGGLSCHVVSRVDRRSEMGKYGAHHQGVEDKMGRVGIYRVELDSSIYEPIAGSISPWVTKREIRARPAVPMI